MDTWVKRFQDETDISSYPQFKGKNLEKRKQMAWAARRDAVQKN